MTSSINRPIIERDVVQPPGAHNPSYPCVRTSCFSHLVQYPFSHFNPPQSEFCEVLYDDCNIVVCWPTGAGKTVAMELSNAKAKEDGGKCLNLFPLKALTEEKLMDWSESVHTFNKYKIVPITGDYVLDDAKKKELESADIIVATSEMLDSKTRNYTRNSWLKDVSLLVVDEAHLLGSPSRGPRLESAIMRFISNNPQARIVLMSATVPNRFEIAEWIESITGRKTKILDSNFRPCILNKTFVKFDDMGSKKYDRIEELRMHSVYENIKKNIKDQQLVFTGPKSWGYKFKDFLIRNGVPAEFHNADLPKEKRREIEKKFREREIHILVSTSTLSWGRYRFGTLVPMLDGSLKKIEDIKVNDDILSFDGKGFAEDKVLKVGTKKTEKAFRITLESGEQCDVSSDHIFYGANKRNSPGWINVKELSVGDFLTVPSTYEINKDIFDCYFPTDYSRRGYLFGFAAGDGCLVDCGLHADGSKKLLLDISGGLDDINHLEFIRQEMSNEFEYDISNIRFDFYGNPHIQCKSKSVSNQFEHVLPVSLSKDNMIIPDIILKDKKLLKSYLSGLFDADASVDTHGGCGLSIELSSISERLIRQVQQILLFFGIRSNVSKREMKDRVINGRYQPAVREYIWRLRIYSENARKFNNRIGFKLSRKCVSIPISAEESVEHSRKDLIPVRTLLYNAARDIGFTVSEFKKKYGVDKWNIENKSEICRSKLYNVVSDLKLDIDHELSKLCYNNKVLWKKIVSIEEVEGGDFQDIEVENHHSYVGNGIISHNCNLPARRVNLAHTTYGVEPMEICDIEQGCGRAGRIKYDPAGDAYIFIPSSIFDEEVRRIQGGFQVISTIDEIPNLAFHAVSEISSGNIKTSECFHEWYEKSLAYAQGKKISDEDCANLFGLLEKIKMIRPYSDKDGIDSYEATSLGQITSDMYMNPFDVFDWFKNFCNIDTINTKKEMNNFDLRRINKDVSMALANCYAFKKGKTYCSKAESLTNTVSNFQGLVGPDIKGGVLKAAACYYSMMNGKDIEPALKGTYDGLKLDIQRILATIKQIHKRYGYAMESISGYKFNEKEWDILYYRIIYGVPKEMVSLVAIPGIGKTYSQRLFDRNIRSFSDFRKNPEISKSIVGQNRYEKIISETLKQG